MQSRVVSYRNSTSNHNGKGWLNRYDALYLIEILHQTTTTSLTSALPLRCILSKFYIKPQRLVVEGYSQAVVSYRNSTSNHNCLSGTQSKFSVVSYRNSTSNHNSASLLVVRLIVVSYRNSTSNHNIWLSKATHKRLYLIEILHQTTTQVAHPLLLVALYLIEILHQTTTGTYNNIEGSRLYLIEILHQTTTLVRLALSQPALYLIEILHQTTT